MGHNHIWAHAQVRNKSDRADVSTDFNFDSTGASLMESSCSSCAVTQDRSAYWTPPLYFLDDNGTYTLVPQVGGMTV